MVSLSCSKTFNASHHPSSIQLLSAPHVPGKVPRAVTIVASKTTKLVS